MECPGPHPPPVRTTRTGSRLMVLATHDIDTIVLLPRAVDHRRIFTIFILKVMKKRKRRYLHYICIPYITNHESL